MKKITLISMCCILPIMIIGIIWFASNKSLNQTTPTPSGTLELQGKEFPIVGRTHVPKGTKVTNYNSNPPTSGDHWPQPAEWGLYIQPLPDEQLVHNLEHGGIWISFKDDRSVDEATDKSLEAIANKYPQGVVITERPENETTFAIASWGRLYASDTFDQEFAEEFIKANINNSPEPLAILEQPRLEVGSPFPDFSVQEVGGKTITRDSLRGRPAIIWFTTSWCVPCQIGAKQFVAPLDEDLGDNAFNVLVIFVDLKEKDSDLMNWRKNFANPDWMIAFDNELTKLAARINLRFLDSKFLLDKNGMIRNIDFEIADENYLNTIREIVKADQ